MEKLESHIYIISDYLADEDERFNSKAISSESSFKVNITENKYEIIYPTSIIMEIDSEWFAETYINFIRSKMTTYNLVELYIHYIEDQDHDLQYDELDDYMIEKIMDIQEAIYNLSDNNIKYLMSSSMYLLTKRYQGEDEEEYITPVEHKKKRKLRFESAHSRIFAHANNKKRNVKNRGIIISSNKKDKRKDREILKSFLKEFIPGKAPWIKMYRSMVLERWLKLYSMSKKEEKKYRNESRKRKIYYNQKQLTNQLGKIQKIVGKYDPFYDHAR
jgi:hypothetical protein